MLPKDWWLQAECSDHSSEGRILESWRDALLCFLRCAFASIQMLNLSDFSSAPGFVFAAERHRI